MKSLMLLSIVLATFATACSGSPRTAAPTPNIQISDVWMFASEVAKSDQSAPIYMTISNTGGTAVGQLIGAQTQIVTSTDVVNSTQLRNGQERVAQIEIPINGQVEFKPTGYHIEVISLPPTIKAGDTFPLTLAFAGGDSRIITVVVRP